jgi:hypothetical protein
MTQRKPSDQWRDWRGWVALVWALCWGTAYAIMAFQARGALVANWLRAAWR